MAAGDTSGGDDGASPTEDAGSRAAKPLPPAVKRKKKTATTTSGSDSGSTKGRYTPPVPASRRGPSPRWVPVLMFGLWIIGLAMIILNYMGVLPGSEDGGNGFYLVGGLAAILGGIITATQYR